MSADGGGPAGSRSAAGVLESRVARHRGRVFEVVSETVRCPDGRRAVYDCVRHPGAVAILPILLEPFSVVLVRQFRYVTGKEIWEIPAGTLDKPGEILAACARRELLEETGYSAGALARVADFYTAPGFCDERMRLYAAWRLEKAGGLDLDLDERLTVHVVPWPDVLEMLARRDFEDAKTLVAISWLQAEILRRRGARVPRGKGQG